VTTKRSTTLGKGGKYDFTKEANNKNSQFYNMGSDFDLNNSHSPKWTFGIGRNFFEKVYQEKGKILDKNIPGPGLYNIIKPFGNDGQKYSMPGKNNEEKDKVKKIIVPGPGEYNAVSTSSTGRYPLSKFKNTSNVNWSYDKSQKLNYEGKIYL
jgi:hypothetical protein